MRYQRIFINCCLSLVAAIFINFSYAQHIQDTVLEKLLRRHASPELLKVLDDPGRFRYQLIYTRIDRNKKNEPAFVNYGLRVNKDEYFNPASMVKLPVALVALGKINDLRGKGIDKFTTMLTDSSYERQTAVTADTSSENGLPSVAQYIKKIFLVSDNDAYNRLYEFAGQQHLNTSLWKLGYKDVRITRRFVTMNEDQNRHTNQVRFLAGQKLLYLQPAAASNLVFDFSKQHLIGKAHFNREEQLIDSPMNFTSHNNAPLADLRLMLQSVMFPESVPRAKRFNLKEDDYRFLYRYMSMLPSQSLKPTYDTTEFFDSYTKFFFFKAGRSRIPEHIKVFNKTGWSYGFLTDVAYIADIKNGVEFMLSGVIYVNEDGILNDDKYEYEQIGYPFFKEVGEIIYKHELERPRKYKPDLSRFW